MVPRKSRNQEGKNIMSYHNDPNGRTCNQCSQGQHNCEVNMNESYTNTMSESQYYESLRQDRYATGFYHSPSSEVQAVKEGSNAIRFSGEFTKGIKASAQGTLIHKAVEIALDNKTLEFSVLKEEPKSDPVHAMRMAALVIEHLGGFDNEFLTEQDVTGYFLNKYYEGSADIVEVHEDGTATIWDIKNYQKVSDEKLNQFFLQTIIYGSLVQQTLGYEIRDYKISLPLSDVVVTYSEWDKERNAD